MPVQVSKPLTAMTGGRSRIYQYGDCQLCLKCQAVVGGKEWGVFSYHGCMDKEKVYWQVVARHSSPILEPPDGASN